MADDTNKCKNPSCTCTAQPGGKYCSASCEGTGDGGGEGNICEVHGALAAMVSAYALVVRRTPPLAAAHHEG